MTKQQILIKYNALLSAMLKQHEAFCQTQDPEALHLFRLAYKKTQALLYFFTEDRKKCIATKAFKKLKELYAHTGEVRDAQMSIKLLKLINGTEKVIRSKEKKAAKRTEWMVKKQAKHQAVIQKATERTSAFLKNIPDSALQEKFVVAINNIVTELAPANRTDANLHDARKLIKRTGYAGKMLPATLQQKIKLPYTDFKKIEDAIGNWHDSLVLSQYLQTHEGPEESIQELQKLKTAALQQAEKYIQSFLKKPKQLR